MKLTSAKDKTSNSLDWTYTAPKINSGKETIDQMSLAEGIYKDYVVTKTGNLVSMLEVSGVNLDLLSTHEQEDLFSDYGAFLMSTLGEGVDDSLQFIEATIPVDMTEYLANLKSRYLNLLSNHPEETFKIQLIASYINHYTDVQNSKNMTRKQHLVVVKTAMKNKSFESLDSAVDALNDKVQQVKRDLENALTDYELAAKQLNSQETLIIWKNLINYNG